LNDLLLSLVSDTFKLVLGFEGFLLSGDFGFYGIGESRAKLEVC
jgi:hypothetical protein